METSVANGYVDRARSEVRHEHPVKGSLLVQVGPDEYEIYDVQYNPTELAFDKQAQLAEIAIPGLDAPLQQFVRGNAEKLTLELFCDTTDQGIGIGARVGHRARPTSSTSS